jgi:2',3'-cyclic-nucleotide 2'-phosphodiesterase/3'-nucleotidase
MTRSVTRRTAIAATAAATAGWPAGLARAQAPARIRLRLMATTDLHVNVLPYDYFREARDDTVGLARTAALIAQARSEAKNSLLFDNGDNIQGSPLGDYVAYRRGMRPGDTHPMIAAMNALGYACGTLGNHEFNYGLDFLDRAFAGANFPAVCANVVKADGAPLIRPWLLLDQAVEDETGGRHRLAVGVIGFVPPQILQWDKTHLQGKVTAIDIVDAAAAQVPLLKAAGADIVVALCHSGIAGGPRRGGEENAALHLAAVDGIDAVFAGHQHLVFPGSPAFAGIEGADNRAGTLHGKPRGDAGLLGIASRADRPRSRARERPLARGRPQGGGQADL